MLLTAFADDCHKEIAWAQLALSGKDLVDESGDAVALLAPLPATDPILYRYTKPSVAWATVTPVVLPGYDDPAHYRRRLRQGATNGRGSELLGRLAYRVDRLLRKAIVHAGFSQELADNAELEWRRVGFLPGTDVAERYGVPDHLRELPRFHVRLRWRERLVRPVRVPGPLCLGGGRFYGIGLFAAESDALP